MNEFVSANLPLVILGALLLVAVLWWVILATRRTRVAVDRRDTLDEGAAPAARNQALIDAAPAATQPTAPIPPAVPEAIGGAGVAVAAAVENAMLDRSERSAAPTPAPSAAPTVTASPATGDDLTRIKGLGPKLAATLAQLGVTRFEQIAGWSEADIDRIDGQLGRFAGRIRRDSWTEQARFLAAGDIAGFEGRFGAS